VPVASLRGFPRPVGARCKDGRITEQNNEPVSTPETSHGTAEAGSFDERRVGLDHLAFRVADRDELQRWVTHLDASGVPHSGIIDTGYGPTVVFRDPDNMQLEFCVQQNPDELTQLTDADSAEAQRILHSAQ
jgi:glyoxylase I family protein